MKHLVFFVSFIFSSICYSADPAYNSYRDKGAVRGYDVVAYFNLKPGDKAVKGSAEFSYRWQDVDWYFSSAENRAKFIAEPTAYAPQYGGYCAFAVGQNFTTSIRPNSWLIHDNKLYLNHNGASKKAFKRSLSQSIARANQNWPSVLTKCERRGRCRKPS